MQEIPVFNIATCYIYKLFSTSIVLFTCLLPTYSSSNTTPLVQLSSDSSISRTGFFRLNWQSPTGHVELQESRDSQFNSPHTIYKGTDQATVITGKANGKWFYRIRSITGENTGPWSTTLDVTVKHHSLTRGLMFFTLGLATFIAIVLLITLGARKSA